MCVMFALIGELDQTGGTIVCGLVFFGTFYFISTLDGFGDPPSRYHRKELFETFFGLYWILFGPAVGAIGAYTLFWS